jgi:hypothetical protein
MAGIPVKKDIAESIVADWRTGQYSQRDLAEKHKVSKGLVGKLCKGVEQDMGAIVGAGVQYKMGLAGHSGRIVGAVMEAVEDQTKHIQFFTSCAITNVQEAMYAPCETQNDFKARAETIIKGRETVLGKTPDTAIQINTTQSPQLSVHQFEADSLELINKIKG